MCARALAVLTLALILGPLPGTGAQDTAAAVTSLVGTYRCTLADGGAARIEEAILKGTEAMGPLRRGIARRRLRENNPAIPSVAIAMVGRDAVVQYSRSHTYRAPLDGAWAGGVAPDGGSVRVRHRVIDGSLVEEVSAGRSGGSRMTFIPDGSGGLTFVMRIHSRHLPGPITYRLPFVRR